MNQISICKEIPKEGLDLIFSNFSNLFSYISGTVEVRYFCRSSHKTGRLNHLSFETNFNFLVVIQPCQISS